MRVKNIFLALKYQLPLGRLFRNFIITRNAWGLFHKNSHTNQSTGLPKVCYYSLTSANRAAESMKKKHNKHFSVYKCVFCDGFHIGKNRDNK